MPAGGLTGREYKVRVLEARYPLAVKGDTAESKEYFERGYENVCGKPTRFVFGNQSLEARIGESKAICVEAQKSKCRDRRVADDTVCRRVFQSLGSDLIAPWLTPSELNCVETALGCSWDWARVWHYGKVKNKSFASRVQFLLPRLNLERMLELYNKNEMFSIFWYLVPLETFVYLVNKHKHIPSLRKLSYLTC